MMVVANLSLFYICCKMVIALWALPTLEKWFLQQRTIPAGKKLHKNQEGAILTHSHSI
jgi:hypothetical protein